MDIISRFQNLAQRAQEEVVVQALKKWCALVSIVACWSCGSTPHGGSLIVAEGGGAIIVPENMNGDELTIEKSPSVYYAPQFTPVGPGYVCGPEGAHFSVPVTVRIPIDKELLASKHDSPTDVVIFTQSVGEVGFKALPTRLHESGQYVEADVPHFSSFQSGLLEGDRCAIKGTCAYKVCELPLFIDQQDIEDVTRASLVATAQSACTSAGDGDYETAHVILNTLLNDVLDARSAGLVIQPIYTVIREFILTAASYLKSSNASLSGTWETKLVVGTGLGRVERPFVVQLHQRDDNQRLMGYILGGTRYRTVEGRVSGSLVTLDFEFSDPKIKKTITFVGVIEGSGTSIVGTAYDESEDIQVCGSMENCQVAMMRVDDQAPEPQFIEHRFVCTLVPTLLPDEDENGDQQWIKEDSQAEVAIVVDEIGNLEAGGFVSHRPCAIFPCGGHIKILEVDKDEHDLAFEVRTGGNNGYTSLSRFQLDYFGDYQQLSEEDKWKHDFYFGEFNIISWDGFGQVHMNYETINVLCGRGHSTTNDDVGEVLAAFGRVADDMETGKYDGEISTPPESSPFSEDYLHTGVDLADFVSELHVLMTKNESANYLVDFNRFRAITTIHHDEAHPGAGYAYTVDYDTEISEIDLVEGPTVEHDLTSGVPSTEWTIADGFRYLDTTGDQILFRGNQISVSNKCEDCEPDDDWDCTGCDLMRLPYQLVGTDDPLLTPLDFLNGGISSFGQHAGEHPEGHHGIDFRFSSIHDVEVVAPVDGEIVGVFVLPEWMVSEYQTQEAMVYIRSGSQLVNLSYLDASSISEYLTWTGVPIPVNRGDAIAKPGQECCSRGEACPDDAVTCVDDDAVWKTSVHFAVGEYLAEICPYYALTVQSRIDLTNEFQNAHYGWAELTEPYLCNDKEKRFPLEVSWIMDPSTETPNPGNPSKIKFIRTWHDEVCIPVEPPDDAPHIFGIESASLVEPVVDYDLNGFPINNQNISVLMTALLGTFQSGGLVANFDPFDILSPTQSLTNLTIGEGICQILHPEPETACNLLEGGDSYVASSTTLIKTGTCSSGISAPCFETMEEDIDLHSVLPDNFSVDAGSLVDANATGSFGGGIPINNIYDGRISGFISKAALLEVVDPEMMLHDGEEEVSLKQIIEDGVAIQETTKLVDGSQVVGYDIVIDYTAQRVVHMAYLGTCQPTSDYQYEWYEGGILSHFGSVQVTDIPDPDDFPSCQYTPAESGVATRLTLTPSGADSSLQAILRVESPWTGDPDPLEEPTLFLDASLAEGSSMCWPNAWTDTYHLVGSTD